MKRYKFLILLFVLLTMFGNKAYAYAYDFAMDNADGITIYYNYYNGGTELQVARSGYSGNVVIPETVTYMNRTRSVTSIDERAFYGCSSLTSITIPSCMTNIGNNAFGGCSGLTKVIVPDIAAWCGLNFLCDDSNPLYYAHHLYSDENTEITSLIIPEGVTSIGWGTFIGCSELTSITIPSSVTSIGMLAFLYCTGLTKVIVPDIAAWCGIDFYDNPLGKARHLYSNENTEITSLTIPSSVTSISSVAFRSCSGLTSVTIPSSVTSIGSSAFSYCTGLTSVTISEGVTSIGNSAFRDCTGLTSITIPSTVTSIGDYAFNSSTILSVVSMINNPNRIYADTFDKNTFMNASLYVPAGTKEIYKVRDGWKKFVFIEEIDPSSLDINPIHGDVAESSRYTLNGLRITSPPKGINIIRYSDGTTKKVIVK